MVGEAYGHYSVFQLIRHTRYLFIGCISVFSKVNVNKKEPVHEISNNVVCTTSKAADQPAHTRSLIRAFAGRLSTL